MVKYLLSWPGKEINGVVEVSRSKSISNRLLILSAISGGALKIKSLSNAEDTVRLQALLHSDGDVLDAGHGGTTIRFLMAFRAIKGKPCILTGSERLRQRPVAPLVEALRQLGAELEYVEKEGFLPVAVKGFIAPPGHPELSISADISSQFISALMMIGTALPEGLTLHLKEKIVSASYIEMTLKLLHQIGIEAFWKDKMIYIPPGQAFEMEIEVEADWSSASYIYGLTALADKASIKIPGLRLQSLQGDAVTAAFMESLDVYTEELEDGLRIFKQEALHPDFFAGDFELCPDIAQTFAVVLTARNIPFTLKGLSTLKVKETDRVQALINELAKIGIQLKAEYVEGDILLHYYEDQEMDIKHPPEFSTYHDHRMALAFSLLSMIAPVIIEDPMVVEKSFPTFWEEMKRLGMQIQVIE
jgi:3-phosphoshikimate 1-carboxyvinyltransferase